MPTYDFRCQKCRRSFDLYLTYQEYGEKKIVCPYCESENVTRKVGRIRFARSEESHLENLADPSNLEGLEDDPRALGKMMRKMSSEVGEEMGPEFNEVIGRLESGQSPEEIEKQMPDLGQEGGEASPGGMMDDDF